MEPKITVFKSMNSHVPQYFEVHEVLDRIRRGVNKKLIDEIRAEPDKEKRDRLKKNLLLIYFSGKFSARKNEDLIEHSGFMCLDFDNFPNRQTIETWKSKIKSNKHTFALFTSPSGNGLKVLIKVPKCKSNDEHNARFDALAEYYSDCKYFDKNVKGVSRVCYESYDSNVFINDYAEVFSNMIEITHNERIVSSIVIDTKHDTVAVFNKLLIWFEQKYDLKKGNRNNNIFHLCSACRSYNISYEETYSLVYEYIYHKAEDPGSIASELKMILESAYRKPAGNKQMVSLNTESIAVSQDDTINTDSYIYDDAPVEQPTVNSQLDEVPVEEQFWKWGTNSYKIDFHVLKSFLQKNGFYRYEINEKDFIFVRIVENTVEEVDVRHIKDFILKCLSAWDRLDIYNIVAESVKIRKEFLNYLDPIEINWNKDSEHNLWAYFNNVAVNVTRNGIELVNYVDLNGFIWKSKKLKRNFTVLSKEDSTKCDFARFISNICNKDKDRIDSFNSGVGYLLHGHKNKSTARAIIFNDEIMAEEAMGGTGKGLTMQVIATMKNVVIITGADFSATKDFAWQRVNLDTDIVLIDDIDRNFNFRKLFTFITDGWSIRKMYQGETFIKPENAPKVAITTNYSLKGDTDSYERRKFELELYPYYSKNHQPVNDFGREFITNWPVDEFNRCDNYMLHCAHLYLLENLIEPKYINLVEKKLISNTSEDFVAFAESILKNNYMYNKRDLYKHYKHELGIPFNDYPNQRVFTSWLNSWGRYNSWHTNTRTGKGGLELQYGNGEFEWVSPYIERLIF